MIQVVVKSPKEQKDITVNENDSVKALKSACCKDFSASVEQMCIIYSKKILDDSEILSHCGVYDGATVHLVIKSAHHSTDEVATQTSALPKSVDVSATPFGLGALGGISGLGNIGLGSANFMDLQQKIMQELVSKPDTMQALLNSSFVKQMMSSPDLMRQLMSTNPQLCEVMEKHPEIMQTMADPEIMGRMIDVAKSPAMLQELMRGQEHLIGKVQVPSTASASATSSSSKDVEPTEQPQLTTISDAYGSAAMQSMLQQMAYNPQLMSNIMQAPYVQSMLQSMSSNESLVQQMLLNSPVFANSPQLQQQLPNVVPFFAQQLQNAEVQNVMTNPRALHALLLIQQGMHELYTELPSALGQSVPGTETSDDRDVYTEYMSQMLRMVSGDEGSKSDEERYALQLQQLAVMGFTNEAANVEALSSTQGDLNSAVNRLKAESK